MAIATAFSKLDIHDDTLESLNIVPAVNRRTLGYVEMVLLREWQGRRRSLRLARCANVELKIDLAILLNNAPWNTAAAEATSDQRQIKRIIRAHEAHWNLTYELSEFALLPSGDPPPWWEHPLTRKLREAKNLVLFRIAYFGGIIDVLAQSFSIKRVGS